MQTFNARIELLKRLVFVAFMAIMCFALMPLSHIEAGSFDQGNVRLSVSGGGGHAFGDDYVVLGLGVGYYVFDGLELGLDADAWFGDPEIYTISPQVRYVVHQVPNVKPYAGAFYRRTFIEGLDDLDAVGFRGGAFFTIGRGSYLGVGAVYDIYLDCDRDEYESCSDVYPEIVLSFAF